MNIEKFKNKLIKEKENIEKQLEKFAKKEKEIPDNWSTRFPSFNGSEIGSAALEKAADEVEEYSTLLPIEHSLELRLRDINLALNKIEKGKYGICEKCGEKIPEKRLKVTPETRFCLKCKK